jgi:DNA-binding NtrC family response regulator
MVKHTRVVKQVLVVDDDREMRDLLSEIASYAGCRALKARSANRALSILEVERVDLMLLDLYMPGGNGVDLLSTLKRRQLEVSTLVVSGYVSASTVRQLVELGVRGIVAKPFDVGRLMEDMTGALGLRGRTENLEARCTFCDNAVRTEHRFCMNCGRPLKARVPMREVCVPA